LECRRCAGFWLGAHLLEDLVEKASRGVELVDFRLHGSPPTSASGNAPQQRGPMYRKCPVCGDLMNRDNYAHRSGVIIDICKEHGVWFDADELARILDWVRSGAKAESDRRQIADTEHQKKLAEIAEEGEETRERRRYGGSHMYFGPPEPAGILGTLIAEIATTLFRGSWRN
jgi:Zn-finger nucleic acid-binding protein